jgi:hypothetical protein
MMKKSVLFALVSAAAFSLSAVVMAQETKPPEVNISGVPLNRDVMQHATQMSESDFAKFKRTYELANGNTLALFNRNDMKYAKLADGVWHSIVATGPNSLASKDHQLKMEINLQEDETVSGYLVMPATAPSVADNGAIEYQTVKVAFR